MKIYNTLTNKKEDFKEQEKGIIKFYCCGPTVYNLIHIGNARPICVCDVIRRYLEYNGFDVVYVQNFTDIDDKIIKKANEEGTDYLTVSKRYIDEYKKDAHGLNIKDATVHPLATENIDYMLKIISDLINKGYAYKSEISGDVYFDVSKFKDYGKLSGQSLENLESGARIDVDEQKQSPLDFVLWKRSKEGEPFWDSPFGKGRPGWHIECSAMVYRYLGKTIDIHFGGQDLIFPHHENEIAQSESFTGKKLSNYWMHNGYINVNNQKMSKSLNNFFTVRDVSKKYGYAVVRFFLLSSHYRSPLNYSEEILSQCKNSLERLSSCRNNLEFLIKNSVHEENVKDRTLIKELEIYREEFFNSLADDFSTADAITSIFNLTKKINIIVSEESKLSYNFVKFAIEIFDELCEILGFSFRKKENDLDSNIRVLIEKREKARKDKNWELSDALREKIEKMGVKLEDTKDGVKWSYI